MTTQPKILVIDDDPDVVEAIRLTLEANKYKVYSASSGSAGLKRMKDVNPDLIILDVMMDTTTEGFQISLQLRNPDPKSEYAKYAHIPILLLTAIHKTTPLRFGPDVDYLPVDEFVEKPVQPAALLEKVKKLLAKKTK